MAESKKNPVTVDMAPRRGSKCLIKLEEKRFNLYDADTGHLLAHSHSARALATYGLGFCTEVKHDYDLVLGDAT